jgi:hypothetical protein
VPYTADTAPCSLRGIHTPGWYFRTDCVFVAAKAEFVDLLRCRGEHGKQFMAIQEAQSVLGGENSDGLCRRGVVLIIDSGYCR